MSGFGFHTLALLVAIGLAGPLLASLPGLRIPVVIGELLVGVVVGKTGFGIVDHTDPTFTLLANVGFALVMFVVGTHVPVRDSSLRSSIPRALARAVLVGAVAAVLGAALAELFGTGHAALYAVLMASSSAALALPVMDSLGLDGPPVLSVTAQIAIADTASIVLLPLVIDPDRAATGGARRTGHRGVRGGAVLGAAYRRPARTAQAVAPLFGGAPVRAGTADQPPHAVRAVRVGHQHARVDHAGRFRARIGGGGNRQPRRLARQLFGITEGFFGPLFFVWLGASLQVRELGEHPGFILLGIGLGVGAVLAHCAARMLGLPLTMAVLSGAQLGVPVAAATLGTQQHLLVAGEPSALMLGALLTIASTSIAGAIAARRQRAGSKEAAG